MATAHRIGLELDAKRLAKKYVDVVDKIYDRTGRLYEKYNVETGDLNVVGEYGQLEMLGWTAGVYIALYKYLNTDILI